VGELVEKLGPKSSIAGREGIPSSTPRVVRWNRDPGCERADPPAIIGMVDSDAEVCCCSVGCLSTGEGDSKESLGIDDSLGTTLTGSPGWDLAGVPITNGDIIRAAAVGGVSIG
jgi:hypothetical protein